MHVCRVSWWGLGVLCVLLVACWPAQGQQLPLPPLQESGQGVTGAFEGWFPNPDGTFSLLVGYYNRNRQEALDIPIGPNNQIEPGGPDQGQPTHFASGRGWGIFTITVPKDFGAKRLTWTLSIHGQTTAVPLSLNVLWRLEPFKDANGDTPPYIGFSDGGPFVNGPVGQSESLAAKVGVPLPIPVWLADDAVDNETNTTTKRPEVAVHWFVLRGPSDVKFDKVAPTVEKSDLKSAPPDTPFRGEATASATFSAPGDYLLDMQAYDSTSLGGGGDQCCWSNAKVAVSVKP